MNKFNERGLKLLTEFEGLKLKAYYDIKNILTIGYGHTGKDVLKDMVITKQQAEELLLKDLSTFCDGVAKLVKVPINDNQFSALVCLAYNIGLGRFGTSSVLASLNNNNIKDSADSFLKFSKATINGKLTIIPGLLRRREAERALFLL